MKYCRNLFLSPDIDNAETLLSMVYNGIPPYNLYLVCIAKNTNSAYYLEIYHSIDVYKEINRPWNYQVLGIAYGKKQAFALVKTIVEDYYIKYHCFSGFKNHYVNKCSETVQN